DVFHVLDKEVVLHTGAGDAHGVDFLEGVLADRSRRYLAGDDDHRDRIAESGGNAGHGIGCARAGGNQRNADAFRATGIAVGSVYRGLFMPGQYVTNLLLAEKSIVDIENGAARIAEDILDLFFL